jgi:hypothetical protein
MHPEKTSQKRKSIPILIFVMIIPGANGIIAKLSSADAITIAGAKMKMNLSAKGGTQSSLKNILIISANTCISPNGPTLFGPYLSWNKANSLLSTQIRRAAIVITTINTPRIIRMDSSIFIRQPRLLL